MVNASLNWASPVGLFLVLYAVVAELSSIAQIIFYWSDALIEPFDQSWRQGFG